MTALRVARRVRIGTRAAMTMSATVWLAAVLAVAGGDILGRAQTPAATQDESDYGYGNRNLTDAQRAGRDTWYFWTGGNEKFWVKMAELTEGNVNLLAYVDSRLHGRRFATLGAITQPGCRPATAPDQYGLWMDQCDQPPVPGCPRRPVRHRRPATIPQPEVRQGQLERRGLFQDPGQDGAAVPHRDGVRVLPRRLQSAEPAGERRSAEMVQPCRRHRQPVLGGRPAVQLAHAADRLPLARRQPSAARDVGYVRVSRPTTSTIRTRSTSIFNLAYRPTEPEKMADGSTRQVHHILKDGAGFDWRRRRVAARLREHRHVLRLLADAARPGHGTQAAAAVQHRLRAQELRGLAQHRSADGERRGVPQDHRADAPGARRPAAQST